MKIIFKPEIMLALQTYVSIINTEFSGLGFVERKDGDLYVYDFALGDIGTYAETEIPTEILIELMKRPDADKVKLWLHKHPMGTGKPGPENWSHTDNKTIREAPLGGIPELVGWSASVVFTPKGPVGRIDNHKTGKTMHCTVEPNMYAPVMEQIGENKAFRDAKVKQKGNALIKKEILRKLGMTEQEFYATGLKDEDLYDMFIDDLDLDDEVWLREELEEHQDAFSEDLNDDWYNVHEVWRNDGSYQTHGAVQHEQPKRNTHRGWRDRRSNRRLPF